MSIKKLYYCDRCGNETISYQKVAVSDGGSLRIRKGTKRGSKWDDVDLCAECKNSLKHWWEATKVGDSNA